MSSESTMIHRPGDDAPSVTELVAKCQVCGVTWQVRGDPATVAGCNFCDAPAAAVRIISEAPTHGGGQVGFA